MITQERLKELYTYDPETGIFRYRTRRRGSRFNPGDVAGCDDGRGYVQFTIDGKRVRGHQMAFLYMTGRIPKYIDHKDTIKSNNAWGNLRESTKGQNSMNRQIQPNNRSGEKGVYWDERDQVWTAEAQLNGQKVRLYRGRSQQKAIESSRAFRKANHGEFYRER